MSLYHCLISSLNSEEEKQQLKAVFGPTLALHHKNSEPGNTLHRPIKYMQAHILGTVLYNIVVVMCIIQTQTTST